MTPSSSALNNPATPVDSRLEAVKISIVVPVYNSQECLAALNEEIEKALSNFGSYELILVDDKSTDKSWDKISEICAANKNAVGIGLRKNSGQDNALLAGLRRARGQYVVIMDDDLQHAPSDILLLYKKCAEGFDVCYANFSTKKQKGWKNVGSWLNGKLSEKLLSKPKEIYLSPFKVIRREVVDELMKFSGAFPYIDATILAVTSNLAQIEVEHHPRFRGKSNYSLFGSIAVFIRHATGYSIYPLRLATMLGFYCALFSFMMGAYFLFDYFYSGADVKGWMSLTTMIILFSGFILMSLGIIGEYVGRIYLSINSRPQYTIEKVIAR